MTPKTSTPSKGQTPRQGPPGILAVKASAGAGKTRQLTVRFLELLNKVPPSRHDLRQIVAITFTNRAAAEMKDRIILALKEMALETDEGKEFSDQTGMKPAQAATWLDIILDNFSDFQVRTIDSLIYTLMRAFAIEMGLPPELEADFDQDALLDRCFDRVLASVEWDNDREFKLKLVLDLLETFLFVEESAGMVVERKITERVRKLYTEAGDASTASTGAGERVRPDLAAAEKNLIASALAVRDALRRTGLDACLSLNKCKLEYFESPRDHLGSAFMGKAAVTGFMKKSHETFPGEAIASVQRLFIELQQAADAYCMCHARARLHAYVVALDELRREVKRETQYEGTVLGGQWLQLTRTFLEEGNVTGAYTFLKFGSMIRHFLIDEFQDTSPQQWRALFPLVEETLSTGGTLFYVGDVKQAIYGWRGGDWRLFPEVVGDQFASVPADARAVKTLGINYRSLPEIVEFNNKVFGVLRDPEVMERLAVTMMPDGATPEAREMLKATVTANFEDARQEVRPEIKERAKRAGRGRVEIVKVAGSSDEIADDVREHLVRQVKRAWERSKQGIAILVRSNKHAEQVATWLVAEGIPIVTENSLRLKTSALIKGIASLLHFLEYPLDDMAFWGAVASPLFRGVGAVGGTGGVGGAGGVGDCDQAALDAFLRQGTWASPLYKTFEREFPSLAKRLVRPLATASGRLAPYELVQQIIDRFDLLGRFPDESVFIYRFLEVAYKAEAKGSISLSLFLEFWDEGGMEEQIGLPEDVSAVRVLTIHKAKGLEFPVVFIPFTNWKRDPRKIAVTADGDLVSLSSPKEIPLPRELKAIKMQRTVDEVIENLNLLYVASTRAREELYLYVTCLARGEKSDSQYLSAWLEEMLREAGVESDPTEGTDGAPGATD